MVTPDSSLTPLAASEARPDRAFPTLTSQHVSRIAAHGQRRPTTRGEVLVAAGDRAVPFFVVLSGELQVLRPTDTGEMLIASFHAGQFSGESNMITGRNAIVVLRVTEPGEVIQLNREQLVALIENRRGAE